MRTSASDHVDRERYFSNIRFERRASRTEFVVLRDVDAVRAGTIVHCDEPVAGGNRTCRLTPDADETITVPDDALAPYVRSWEQTCYMPHDPKL